MLNNILTEVSSLVFSKFCLILIYYYIISIYKVTTESKYGYTNNLFGKPTIQIRFYLFSIWWFFLWIHVPNDIVNIFKFTIHCLLIFRWRKKIIRLLFYQSKWSYVIGIISPTSSNNYVMINMMRNVYQLNQCHMVTDVIQNIWFLFIYGTIL